jgi:hypothetical protein
MKVGSRVISGETNAGRRMGVSYMVEHAASRYYILDGKVPVEAVGGVEEWARWFEGDVARRIVRQEYRGGYFVSTVFLGLPLGFDERTGAPLVFETMVHAGTKNENDGELAWMSRSSTWELALEQHRAALAWVDHWK